MAHTYFDFATHIKPREACSMRYSKSTGARKALMKQWVGMQVPGRLGREVAVGGMLFRLVVAFT